MYIYIYIYTYTHTHTHIHTRTYTLHTHLKWLTSEEGQRKGIIAKKLCHDRISHTLRMNWKHKNSSLVCHIFSEDHCLAFECSLSFSEAGCPIKARESSRTYCFIYNLRKGKMDSWLTNELEMKISLALD